MNYDRIFWLIIIIIIGCAGAVMATENPLTSGMGFLLGFSFAVAFYFSCKVEASP